MPCRETRPDLEMGSQGLIEIVGAQGYRRKYPPRYNTFVALWLGHRSVGGGSIASSGLVNLNPGADWGHSSRIMLKSSSAVILLEDSKGCVAVSPEETSCSEN